MIEANGAALESVRRLVERAQAAGAVRSDVPPDEVPLLLASTLNGSLELCAAGSDLWRRHFTVVLDGLRAGTARTD